MCIISSLNGAKRFRNFCTHFTKFKHKCLLEQGGYLAVDALSSALKALGLSRGHQESWKVTCHSYLLCIHVSVCLCECTCMQGQVVQMLFLWNHSSCFWDSSSFFGIKLAKQAKHLSSEFQRSRCHLWSLGLQRPLHLASELLNGS